MPLLHPTLRYVPPGSIAGIRRRRRGAGFSYYDERGHLVTRPAELSRIRRIAIPPAWRDVWICPDPQGHVQATGRDARGRLQYRYHPTWSEHRSGRKFGHLAEFCRALPRLRRRVRRDLACPCLCRRSVAALVVALIERGHLRVGNDEYSRANGSFGATTLERRHVNIDGDRIELRYRGKSGVQRVIQIEDRRLARTLDRCLELRGARVFRCLDEAGRPRRVTSADVNAYLRDATGGTLTAKYFRTWAASVCCLARLAGHAAPASPTAGKRAIRDVVGEVAARLGHTPTVCRQSYVHPAVLGRFLEGKLSCSARLTDDKWRFGGSWVRVAERALEDLIAT
jgi:DNA topoisomerase-1